MPPKTFDALPSWNDVESSPSFQAADAKSREQAFELWRQDFIATAADDPDNLSIEGWQRFKERSKQKKAELRGANGFVAATEEADAEAADETPDRLVLADRRRQLESKASKNFFGGGGFESLTAGEQNELTNLRNTLSESDDDDLAAVEEVANDDREFYVVNGKFYASPSLALSKTRYRETVNAAQLTPEQKADALINGRKLREDVGSTLKSQIDTIDQAFEDTWIGGMDKFREFEKDAREGEPNLTDADIMERWQKENGSWYSNLGTQIKLGALRGASNTVGAYYGVKRLLGAEDEETVARAEAAGKLSQDLTAGIKATGGATLAADAADMVVTSLATAPAGLGGRGLVAAGRLAAGAAGRTAAAATAGRIGTGALVKAATLKAGGEAAAKIAARQAAISKAGGLSAASFAAGLQSAGGAFNQYFDEFLKDELSMIPADQQTPEVVEAARRRARDGARARALISGATTAIITAGFGATGGEILAAPQASKAAQAAKEGLFVFLGKSLGKEALSEASEEGLDELVNQIVDKVAIDPSKPVGEIVADTMKAAAAGGLLGAGMRLPYSVMDAYTARQEAKKNPVVQQQLDVANSLEAAGAPSTAAVLREQANAQVSAITQEDLDRKAAEAQRAAEAALDQQPAYQQATVVARELQGQLDALTPDDPAREEMQQRLDGLRAAITANPDAMVPVAEPEVAAPVIEAADPFAEAGEVPVAPPTQESTAAPTPAEPTDATEGPQPTPGGVGTTVAPAETPKANFAFPPTPKEPTALEPQTPTTTDDTQAKEPPAGGLPTVEGQPAVRVQEGQVETRAPSGSGQGQAVAAKAAVSNPRAAQQRQVAELVQRLSAGATPPAGVQRKLGKAPTPAPAPSPQENAIEIIQREMFEAGSIPSSSTVSSKLKALTNKGLSNGSPELKNLVERLRKTWADTHPSETGTPAGYFIGSVDGSDMKPISPGVSEKSINDAGGRVPYKIVNGERVGFFTNDPVITAKQINAGLKITVPAELRSKLARGITIDKATGEVTEAYDYTRGKTPVKAKGDWHTLYRNSQQRAERAEALLVEGENVAKKTGKTLEELTDELRRVTNRINAGVSNKGAALSEAVIADLKRLKKTLVDGVVAMTKTQNPRIPFVGTDAYLAEHAPAEVPGEGSLLKSYLKLGQETTGTEEVEVASGMSYVENLVRRTLDVNWPSMAESDMVDRMEYAVNNEATVKVRKAIMANPGVDPETLLPSLPNMVGLVKGVIKKFAEADRTYRSVITGSIDETLDVENQAAAGLAAEVAQVDADALVERMSEDEAAAAPLTEEETDALRKALQTRNNGDPDEFSFNLLKGRPLQARRALAEAEKNLDFKVGPDGDLIYEFGPSLKKDESQALGVLLKGVVPEGSTDLVKLLSSRPNVARFFIDLTYLGREALKKVKTEAGALKYNATELQKMNLVDVFTAVHKGDKSAAGYILNQAKANLAAYSNSSSISLAEAASTLKNLLSASTRPTEVRGRAATPTAINEQRAQEKVAELKVLVESSQGTIDSIKASLTNLQGKNLKLSEEADKLREMLKKPDTKKDIVQRELNKVIGTISRNKENIALAEESLRETNRTLEEATKAYAAVAVRSTPPPAAVVAAKKAEIDEALKNGEKKAEAKRRQTTSPAPTKAVNAGLAMTPEPPTPVNTEAERSMFNSELAAIGLTSGADVNEIASVLRRLSTREGTGSPHFKALARVFSDKLTLLGGIDSVQILDDPALSADVSVVNGVLTLNVAAMTPTLDGTPRGPEALLRGVITHATKSLTSPDAVLNDSQLNALDKLEALRQEAAAMESTTRAPGLQPRFTDALKDAASFIDAMLTSPEFGNMLQSYKTSVKTPGLKSAWGRFWAALGELLTGKSVATGSTLHVGLMAAGDLMVSSPCPGKRFLDSIKAIIHNPEIAFPKGRTASAEEISHQQRANEAVELADSPASLDTVEARLLGDDSVAADPEGTSESNAGLMPDDSMLGSSFPDPKLMARDTEEGIIAGPPSSGRVTFVPRVSPPAPAGSDLLTQQQAYAGLADAIRTIDLADKVARGVLTTDEAGAAVVPSAIQGALAKITAAIERLKNSPATNKGEFIPLLEDMRAFLELESEQIVAPPSKFDDMSESVQDIDTETLPEESEVPVVEEGGVPFAQPYVETTVEDGTKQSIDFGPFLRAAAIKTGRRVAMVDAGPGVADQPLYVRHDRTDTTIYMNRNAAEALVKKLRSLGYNTEEMTAHINALLDREASTLAILQRFSDGELLATARSLSPEQRRKIIKRVYGLSPRDPGFMNYFSMGKSGYSQDVTADMIQLGADYYRMMRQVAETGHTTEDVMEMITSTPGSFARTVAFLRATARQFMTWWRAYGDVAATRAILNIDSFLEATTSPAQQGGALFAPTPKPSRNEVVQEVARRSGKTIDEVLEDADQVRSIRENMKREVLNGETPETTPLSSEKLEAFAKDTLGLVEGDGASVARALSAIADLPGVNPATRAIAKELSQNPDVMRLSTLSFYVGALSDGSGRRPAGAYLSQSHALALNLPMISKDFGRSVNNTLWSKAWLVEVLVHEASHAVTSVALENYSRGVEQPPKVQSAIKDLGALYNAVKTQPGATKWAYELSSLEEFTSGVMANPRFVAWLSTVPSSVGSSIPGQKATRSFIKRVLSRIYQIIFPNMEIDSVLEKSLSRIFDIASHPHVVTKPSNNAFGGVGVFQSPKALEGAGILLADKLYAEERQISVDESTRVIEDEIEADLEFELAAEEMRAHEASFARGERFAFPPMPGRVTGERKRTEALKNSLPAMPEKVAEYLKDSTYFSEVSKGNFEIIDTLIGKSLAAATGPADFASIALSLNELPMTDAQRYLARVVVGQALNRRFADLEKAMEKDPTPGGLGLLEDYEGVVKSVWGGVMDVSSNAGQVLSMGNIARDYINPKIVTAAYRDAATKVTGGKLPQDVRDAFIDLKAEADDVVAGAVKKSPLTKKIVSAVAKASGESSAEVQMMFDFMETMQDYLDRGTGVPIPAKMAEWVSDKMLSMVDTKVRAQVKKVAEAAGVSEQTFFEEYSDEVKRQVAERINKVLADAAPARPDLTPAQQEAAKKAALDSAIREIVASFEFAPSVERALNLSRAKLLARLEASKGSTPEALKQYEAAKAAIAAMTFDLVPLSKATNIVRRSFDMREQIYLSMTEQRANVVQLAAMISNTAGLNAEQSRKVAEAFKTAYEAEMNRRIQKTLTSYMTRRSMSEGRGAAERYSRSERFMRLARIGGLRQEEFYNAMATEFGLPAYDPAIADELDREAARIMAMPLGSVQRNDSVQALNARIVNETYKSLMKAYGAKAVLKDKDMAWEYLAGIPVAMWKSGVLSGFGTAEVNLGFGTIQSIMDLGFNATAYAVKAKDPALATSNLLTLMRAVGWIADPLQRKEVFTEIKRAALTGRTRFASEQSENLLVLERDIPAIDAPGVKTLMSSTKNFFKLLGRIGSVIDATVSVPAAIARQRLALEYALTMSGADRKQITEIMQKSFSPDELDSREINEVLDSERDQFRNSPRPDLAMQARRFQLAEQRRAQLYSELTSRLDAKSKEDFMGASRESARFANLGTTPTGLSGAIFDRVFGSIERQTKGLSSIVVSFPRAMGNLLDFSLAMSVPGLSFARANNVSPSNWLLSEDSRYKRELVEKDSIKYHKLRAQGIVASVAQLTMGALYWYGLKDEEEGRVPWFMVYGKGYPDSEHNRQLRYRQPNWSPYTVKMGSLYLSWKDIPGFNLLLGGLASLTDDQMVKQLKDPKKIRPVEALANTAVAFVKAVTVKSSLQGLSQAGEILSDNSLAEAVTAQNIGKMITNFVSGATNPRLLRDIVDIGRGIAGGGEYTLKDTRGFTAAAISLLPANALYGAELGQRDMLNSMGQPVTNFWYAPLTKRILPVTASDNVDPVITPLVSAGLFISPVKSGQMTFDTYLDDSDEIDPKGGLLSSFDPDVEVDAMKIFGEQMRMRMTPEYIKALTDLAETGQAGRQDAQKALNKASEESRDYVRSVLQERIFNREIVPHWQEK